LFVCQRGAKLWQEKAQNDNQRFVPNDQRKIVTQQTEFFCRTLKQSEGMAHECTQANPVQFICRGKRQ